MQVERMDGVSGAAKATETARTGRLATGKTGDGTEITAKCFGLETEHSLNLGVCVCVLFMDKNQYTRCHQ